MNWSRVAGKILLGWLTLTAAQVIAGIVVQVKIPSQPHIFEWILASDLLVAAVLGIVAKPCLE